MHFNVKKRTPKNREHVKNEKREQIRMNWLWFFAVNLSVNFPVRRCSCDLYLSFWKSNVRATAFRDIFNTDR